MLLTMIKTLAKCIGEYWKYVVLTVFFVILEVVFDILLPRYMGKLIDLGIESGDMGNTIKYGVLLLVIALMALVAGVMAGRFSATACAGFAKNVRRTVYEKVQTFSFSNIDRFSTGGLVTRMTSDVSNVQMAYMMIIRLAIRSPLMLVFAFFMAFRMGGSMAWIFLFVIPVLGTGLFLVARSATV